MPRTPERSDRAGRRDRDAGNPVAPRAPRRIRLRSRTCKRSRTRKKETELTLLGHAAIFVLFGLLMTPLAVTAQERSAAGYRSVVRLENERVRVVENTYEPGASSPEHAHEWPRVVYVIEGGTLELIDRTGERTRLELEPGTTAWRSPETHTVLNPGPTTVRVLEIEVREVEGGGSGAPARK